MAMSRFLSPFGASRTPARWGDPFVDLQREVKRVFDDVFRGFGGAQSDDGGSAMAAPRIDIDETDNAVQISAELPGVPEDAVEVSIDDDLLTIKGEKKCERKDEQSRVSERFYGTFQRAIQLPFAPDPEQVEASFQNGVLKIALPKRAESQKTRRIQVRTGNGGPGAEKGKDAQGKQASTAKDKQAGTTAGPQSGGA
jgi:HSP20 family protein